MFGVLKSVRPAAAILALAASTISACGGGGPAPTVTLPVAPVVQAAPACARVPYWKAQSIAGETVLALEAKQRYPLWQPTAEITQVKQLLTDVVYVAGRDYIVDSGVLVIPTGSTIPLAPAAFPQTPDPKSYYLDASVDKNGGGLRIAYDYQKWQIAVTYKATPPAPAKAAALPLYEAKLAAKGVPSITYYGDSISAGYDSTAGNSFAELTAAVLKGAATVRNKSVAGWSSAAAKDSAEASLNDQAQDVVVVGFGMNDAVGATIDGPVFKANIKAIITTVRAKAPKTEFVLLSGMRGNLSWLPMRGEMFDAYRTAMRELAVEMPGIVVVDMTTVWDSIVARKTFYDLSDNGINHPADFVHGIYADVLTQAIGPAECR